MSPDSIINIEQGRHLLAGEYDSDTLLRRQHPRDDLPSYGSDGDDGSSVHEGLRAGGELLPGTSTVGRNISWTSAYIIIMSRMVGSGIFAIPGTVARSTGSIGLSLLVWLIGAGIAACGLVVSLEFGCMFPRSGGDKVYLEFIYRRPRFLMSVMIAAKAMTNLVAGNCVVFSQYILFCLGIEQTAFARKFAGVGLLVFAVVIHGCFLKAGILIQNVLGWFKLVLMCFMVLTALVVVLFPLSPHGVAKSDPVHSTWDSLWEGSNWGWGSLSLAIFKVIFAYDGYDSVNNVMNEVTDPVKTLKTVTPSALGSVCILYLLVNCAYFVIVPMEEIKSGGELIAGLFFDKLFGPKLGGTVLPLLISISVAGSVMVASFSLSRVNQEIARQGFLPFSRFLSSSRPFNAPLGGLIVLFIPSFLVIVIPPPGDVYSFILNVEAYPSQVFALAVTSGLLWLRWTQPSLKRPFRAWLPAVWLRIAVCLALVAAPFVPPKGTNKGEFGLWYGTYALVAIGILVTGFVYWYVWSIAMPRWKGYHLEESVEVHSDGTRFISIRKVKR